MNKNLYFKIGLEIHVQLNTKHKMFSNSKVVNSSEPNICISNIEVGEVGFLPQLNSSAIAKARILAEFLKCKINKKISFLRKNYFYPDLPKGYQLTQLHNSIGLDGCLQIPIFQNLIYENNKIIKILRVQIEEDTAKQNHLENFVLFDYNRASIPLIEIVTAPDFSNIKEIHSFIKILRTACKFLNISNCRFELGEIRCDVNISLNSSKFKGNICEIKNLNSLNSITHAIEIEREYQLKKYNENVIVPAQTKKITKNNKDLLIQRAKMIQSDYNFFYEMNLPTILLSEKNVEIQKNNIFLIKFNKLLQNIENYDIFNIIFNNLIIFKLIMDSNEIDKNFIHFVCFICPPNRVKLENFNLLAKIYYFCKNNKNNFNLTHSIVLNLIDALLSDKNLNLNTYLKTLLQHNISDNEIYKFLDKIFLNFSKHQIEKFSNQRNKFFNILFGKLMQKYKNKISIEKLKEIVKLFLNKNLK